MAIQTAYKVTAASGRAHYGGVGAWGLPHGQPGAWKTVRGDLIPCQHGLHLCRRQDLVFWLGPAIWLAEYDDAAMVVHKDKIVVRKARLVERLAWDERIARLFAADCAEWAIRYAKKHGIVFGPSEKMLRNTIRTARAFANGTASSAQCSAAYSAAREWQTRRLLEYLTGKRG